MKKLHFARFEQLWWTSDNIRENIVRHGIIDFYYVPYLYVHSIVNIVMSYYVVVVLLYEHKTIENLLTQPTLKKQDLLF